MNPNCPECHTELPEDFGIVTCSNCGAVCSVDLDGNAEVQGEVESPSESLSLQEETDGLEDETSSDSSFEEDLLGDESDSFDEDTLGEGLDDLSEPAEEPEPLDPIGDDGGELLAGDESLNEGLQPEEDSLYDSEESEESEELEELEELEPVESQEESSDLEEDFGDLEDLEPESDDGELSEDSLEGYEEDLDNMEMSSEENSGETHEAPSEEGELEPLSGEGFFKNLELFTEQLEPQDHHHSYYQLKVSGFETESELEEVLDLTLDDRLGLIKEGLSFDETNQSFVIPKISFLRLVALHKRLSTLRFLSMEWDLTEDQSDITDDEGTYEDEEATEVGDSTPEVEGDDTLYEEVDESDY